MNSIETLWNDNCKLPTCSGLYFANGKSYSIDIEKMLSGDVNHIAPFDLAKFISENEDSTTFADITNLVSTSDGNFLCSGECSFGEEGFFALVDSKKNLVWVIYFDGLNPFNDLQISGSIATATSTSNVQVVFEICNPINLKINHTC